MINPAFDVSVFLDPRLRKVAVALQVYGAMVVDTCDYVPFIIYGEMGSSFDLNYDNRAQLGLLQAAMTVVTYH